VEDTATPHDKVGFFQERVKFPFSDFTTEKDCTEESFGKAGSPYLNPKTVSDLE
jgi:hypothetical protein